MQIVEPHIQSTKKPTCGRGGCGHGAGPADVAVDPGLGAQLVQEPRHVGGQGQDARPRHPSQAAVAAGEQVKTTMTSLRLLPTPIQDKKKAQILQSSLATNVSAHP